MKKGTTPLNQGSLERRDQQAKEETEAQGTERASWHRGIQGCNSELLLAVFSAQL